MKRLLLACLFSVIAGVSPAQDIALPAPQKSGGLPLMEALAKRCSTREYDARELSDQQLSDLLWAGFGITRADGRRTAPSASNKQENEIYVLQSRGAYVYDAGKNALRLVVAEDLRSLIKRADAPVVLLYVADLTKRGPTGDNRRNVAAIDSGFMAQNVYLYCASAGLATVYRGGFDKAALTPRLRLRPEQEIIAVQPVGYPKKTAMAVR